MNRGKFIVLEGVNSCGKTTIQNLLIARLIKEFPDKKFISTAEPTYDLPIGKIIRNCYLKKERKADDLLMANLYAMDRYDSFSNPDNGLLVKINNGCNIIQSRNYLSSLAMLGSNIDYMYHINKPSIDLLSPDVIIVLERDFEDIIEYHKKKSDIDIFENDERLKKSYDGYKKAINYLRENTNENIIEINCPNNIDITFDKVWNIIKDLF